MAELWLAGLLAALGIALSAARFAIGPRAVDRVVAFDALTIISVAGLVIIALATGRAIYLDVALVYALLSFLGVIVAARYLEGGE
ncbi:multicomponent Na+:H+ antiporter subunit F [Rhodobacter aestuarii]|uniref:Multicomponent Na+:H+ antiporter subunit F n=1 Tax=Rhodobacter aestuarii TaxID=453582 RepID=A0A1N7M0Q4_9RHOB|nr:MULTISPECIES: monovalent cation/H+ antiporter complex subunit F [Rhodobacter]PTV94756.1 multicomponent Na+:H+ antiporter subunit F [Rhodobacter aestuarii]SIS79511.1 multicomponent Na+:H+ antiporter subunit F [Rhodobacter aestuarii]SOC14555.1 multicomponent Na+:H+ antiporter subunit F [Rhodobacter sp. JA431]